MTLRGMNVRKGSPMQSLSAVAVCLLCCCALSSFFFALNGPVESCAASTGNTSFRLASFPSLACVSSVRNADYFAWTSMCDSRVEVVPRHIGRLDVFVLDESFPF
eukprot:RCo042661